MGSLKTDIETMRQVILFIVNYEDKICQLANLLNNCLLFEAVI
jgi:hypothetical protein